MLQDDLGQGEPHVLIHGLGSSHHVWWRVAPQLARDRRILTVDVPGFGAAPPVGEGYDLEQVAEVLWSELPQEQPVTLVGFSMGGAVALTMAAMKPERTARLVLCAPAGLRPFPRPLTPAIAWAGAAWTDARGRLTPFAHTPTGRRLLMGTSVASAAGFDEDEVRTIVATSAASTRLAAALRAVVGADLRPLLERAPAQLGVVWGQLDRVVPVSQLTAITERRPDAHVALLPGAGHLAMLERPLAFAAVLRQLLTEMGPVHDSATTTPGQGATVQGNARRGV
jgi:pimeloyl-ACP methyl ester carboxylesterase